MRLTPLLLALAALPAMLPVAAAEPTPEIVRDVATAQAVGVTHTLRTIPEACARLEGVFTGEAAQPYKFSAVRTSAGCQPRARLVDAAKLQPSIAQGWTFNDLIQVPSAACPTRMAVVRIWRKPVEAGPPELDAQGRARIYLDESRRALEAGTLAQLPLYAAAMTLEGETCN